MTGEPAVHARALETRLWRIVFLALLALECLPFWIFRYFPSQDGPSHLHNAEVLANYGSDAIYQQYYVLTRVPAVGNILTQYVLAGLLKVAGPLIAEKLLLTGYAVLWFFAFRYFLRGQSRHADYFALFAGIAVPNWFLYMGFWNFCFSVPLALFTLGYYVRRQRGGTRWTIGPLLGLAGAGLAVYMSHVVSWLLCVIAVSMFGAEASIRSWREKREGIVDAVRQCFLPIISLLPPAILLLIQLSRSHESSNCFVGTSLRQRLWPLYSFSFLYTVGDNDVRLAKAVAAILFFAFLCVCGALARGRSYNWRSTGLLATSAVFGAISVAGPACVGSGSYIDTRVASYAWLFFVAWLACALETWPRPALNGIAAAFCAIAILTFFARLPALSRWNQELAEVAQIGESVRAESTVLAMRLERSRGIVDPLGHPVGILTAKPVVDLGNYEAATDYFNSRFREERSPFDALGSLPELYSVPPVFDIARYEKETRGRVDYLLFFGGSGRQETELFQAQISGFKLVRSGKLSDARLYERIPATWANPVLKDR